MIYTIFDVESNGLSTDFSEILEVGYMQVNRNLQILRSGEFYFYKPDWNIMNAAFQIHGLTAEFLKEKCPDDETFNDNIIRLYTLLYDGIIVGKNSNKFDIPIAGSFLRRYGQGLMNLQVRGLLDLQETYTPKFQEYYTKTYGGTTRKKGKLGELVEMIGLSQDEVQRLFKEKIGEAQGHLRPHGALYDTFMTYCLLEYAVKNYGLKI